jgi:DNA-binding transcriptional ArsR family regulator
LNPQLIKDLEETTISFQRLGEKYGVSRQAIFDFCTRKGIKRSKRNHAQVCRICQALVKIAGQPHSEFISSRTIKDQLRLGEGELSYHLRLLRKKGLVSQKFGRLRSRSVELAYQIYFEKDLPPWTIGRQTGVKNFHAVMKKHKESGWDIHDSFITYDDQKERMTTFEASRILGISITTVQRYCNKGILDFRWSPISKRRLVAKESVRKLAEKYGLL